MSCLSRWVMCPRILPLTPDVPLWRLHRGHFYRYPQLVRWAVRGWVGGVASSRQVRVNAHSDSWHRGSASSPQLTC